MNIMALDIGDVRVGIAISDPLHIIATPLRIIDRRKEKVVVVLKDEVVKNKVSTLVYGLPISLDGSQKRQVEKTEQLIAKLKKEMPQINFVPFDERFTTTIAKNIMSQKGKKERDYRGNLDSIAAGVLLQSYLEFKRLSKT